MSYQFLVQAWTNAPIEAEVELQNAIDLHAPLAGMDLQVTGREMATRIDLEDLGRDPDCDLWCFFCRGRDRLTLLDIARNPQSYQKL